MTIRCDASFFQAIEKLGGSRSRILRQVWARSWSRRAAAICGSDLHRYRAPAAQRQNPMIEGHEPSDVVVEVGPHVRHVKVGDRVSVYHWRGCGHCQYCRGGRIMWCADRRGYGGAIHGSDADFLLADERNCLPLPDDVSFKVGVLLACNTETTYEALRKLGPSGRDTLVVFGLGPVGLNALLLAKALGARVLGADVSPRRRELAGELGADAVLDLTVQDVPSKARRLDGKAVFVGAGSREPSINPSALTGKWLTFMGSFVLPIDAYWDLLKLIKRGRISLGKMVTHRFPLDDAAEAFRLADSASAGKVIFVWS